MTVLVYAEPQALRDAARLLPPGSCLEREVQRAILAGRVHAGNDGGWVFDPDRAWVAKVERRSGYVRPRPRAWFVTRVERHVEEGEDDDNN